MEIDILDVNFDTKHILPREVEEAMEDPFALRLLPDSDSTSRKARYFCLGRTVGNRDLFICFWTDGSIHRIIFAREMAPEEANFYQRKLAETL